MVLIPHTAPLRAQQVAGGIAVWLDELRAGGYAAVRTNALPTAVARTLHAAGFVDVQRLALLAHDHPGSVLAPAGSTLRLSALHDAVVAELDATAFDAPWSLDREGVAEVRSATPRHRVRGTVALDADPTAAISPPVAFAISGRSGRHGFLQRLAVHPDHRRAGHATVLVTDALRWMARWRVTRALVNTHVDNAAALELYLRLGFTRLDDDLRVLGRSLR